MLSFYDCETFGLELEKKSKSGCIYTWPTIPSLIYSLLYHKTKLHLQNLSDKFLQVFLDFLFKCLTRFKRFGVVWRSSVVFTLTSVPSPQSADAVPEGGDAVIQEGGGAAGDPAPQSAPRAAPGQGPVHRGRRRGMLVVMACVLVVVNLVYLYHVVLDFNVDLETYRSTIQHEATFTMFSVKKHGVNIMTAF